MRKLLVSTLMICAVATISVASAQTTPPGPPASTTYQPRAVAVPAAQPAAPPIASSSVGACADPDYVQGAKDIDDLGDQLKAFRAPDATPERSDYIKRFAGGDEQKGAQQLAYYSSYYVNAFNNVVAKQQAYLRSILMQGRIAESPYKTATNLADAYDHLVIDNLNMMGAASQRFDVVRQTQQLDEPNAGSAYALKVVFSQLVKSAVDRHLTENFKKFLLQLCGKVSVDAKFGDAKLRVVGCGPGRTPPGWAPLAPEGGAAPEVGECHATVSCAAAYQSGPPTAATARTGGWSYLPNTHFFSASCPRNLCADLKSCIEAEGANGAVPVKVLAPANKGKAVQ